MKRRDFLKVSCIAGGGMLLSLSCPVILAKSVTKEQVAMLTSVIQISEDDKVTIFVYKQEMGQGSTTGIAMIGAEELDANWQNVDIRILDFDKSIEGYEKDWGRFGTGGSTAIEGEWQLMRKAGATARTMLLMAAAARWRVPVSDCSTDNGFVINARSGDKLSYGQLAMDAASFDVPNISQFKNTTEHKIIGKPVPSLKTKKVVKGSLKYSIDEEVDGMLHASIVRSPVIGGQLLSFDASDAIAVDGIIDVFPLKPIKRNELFDKGVRGGIVLLGTSTWACIKARRLLRVKWDNGANGPRQCKEQFAEFDKLKDRTVKPRQHAGHADKGFERAKKVITAEYSNPYMAHGLMEPLTAIADFSNGRQLEVWAGSQDPLHVSKYLADVLNIDKKNIVFHTYHMGGGYGRRYFVDYVMEAALISKLVKKPVKLTWTREDEIQFGAYHPMRKDYYQCALDDDDNIDSLRLLSVSCHEWGGGEMSYLYGFNNLHVASHYYDDSILQCGSWRSVVMHQDTFSREVFIDEIAHTVGQDPLQYRLQQSKRPGPNDYYNSHSPKIIEQQESLKQLHVKVLQAAADLSGWTKPRHDTIGMGVAINAYHDKSFCAQVVEVELIGRAIQVNKVYVVADIGMVVNPNLVKGQIEGSILWGLTPALYGGVEAKNGAVRQSNFHDMPLTKMHESPEIIIQLVNFHDRGPSGAGEFAVPPVAPAISNAIFNLTGVRKRELKELTYINGERREN